VSEERLSEILRKDPRHPRAAYDFVREALYQTVEELGVKGHVSARELLEGIRKYAREQYGPLSRTVFASWGVNETKDFGRIVFNLVSAGEMGKTDDDDIAHFDAVYKFEDAFPDDTGEVEVKRPDEDET
jgi:uncharacterized repeat protein (TIGR04138 family)